MVTHVGTKVKRLQEGAEKLCAGARVAATAEAETRPRKEPVKLKFHDSYSGKKDDNFDNWEASINTYVYLQHIAPEEQVLVAFHALKDEAASFARSLVCAADCEHNMVAYSRLTPLPTFLKLLRERFAGVTRGVRASDKLQTIHSRRWKSARALKAVMDDLVAIPDHGVTATQLVNLFYRAMPKPLRGHFFDKTQQTNITYGALSREVVLFEAKSMLVSTFWHKDLDKGKKWKGRTISGQVRAKDHLILTLDEGGTDEVPYSQIEWGLEEEDSGVLQRARKFSIAHAQDMVSSFENLRRRFHQTGRMAEFEQMAKEMAPEQQEELLQALVGELGMGRIKSAWKSFGTEDSTENQPGPNQPGSDQPDPNDGPTTGEKKKGGESQATPRAAASSTAKHGGAGGSSSGVLGEMIGSVSDGRMNRKIEALYLLRFLKTMHYRNQVMHAVNVIFSVRRRMMRDEEEDKEEEEREEEEQRAINSRKRRRMPSKSNIKRMVWAWIEEKEVKSKRQKGREGTWQPHGVRPEEQEPQGGHGRHGDDDDGNDAAKEEDSDDDGIEDGDSSTWSSLWGEDDNPLPSLSDDEEDSYDRAFSRSARGKGSRHGGENEESRSGTKSDRLSSSRSKSISRVERWKKERREQASGGSRSVADSSPSSRLTKATGESYGELVRTLLDPQTESHILDIQDEYVYDVEIGAYRVLDGNGLPVMYKGALAEFKNLRAEIVRIGSKFLDKEKHHLEELKQEEKGR
ncbi:hypothetical protein CBR_g51466 [Chara braunii]|uniref:Uncharacterized protein n=1 Tax=Chara braunii TaxID=69332 RepID=A0A388K6A3_CHABU|nr:hypothetical protein CBR_g51466 [Chara braunii]|eukprot:GBG65584.1 hypothetical protein CBR_g51466 [Chara braunii]